MGAFGAADGRFVVGVAGWRETRRRGVTEEFGARGTGGPRSGEGYADPYWLYRRWFEAWEDAREGDAGRSVGADEIEELWRHWFRGMARGLSGSAAESLNPLWDQMARSMGEESASGCSNRSAAMASASPAAVVAGLSKVAVAPLAGALLFGAAENPPEENVRDSKPPDWRPPCC